MRRPAVTQVILELGRGGLETMSADLAVEIAARGIRSTVVGLDAAGELEARLLGNGVRAARVDAYLRAYVIANQRSSSR